MLHIKSVKHVSDFTLWVAFDDGTSGNIDLNGALEGSVFFTTQRCSCFF